MCASFGKGTLAEAECLDNSEYKGFPIFPKWTATDALMACRHLEDEDANKTCVKNEFQKRANELKENKGINIEDTVMLVPSLEEKAATASYNDEDASWGANPGLEGESGGKTGVALFGEDGNIIAAPQPSAYAQGTIDSFLGMPARKAGSSAFSDYTTPYSNWNIKEGSAAEREMLGDYGSTQISNTFLSGLLSRRQENALSIPSFADERRGQPQAAAGDWNWGPLAGLVDKLWGENEPVQAYEPYNPVLELSGRDADVESGLAPVYIEQAVPAGTVETEQTDYSDYYQY